MRLLNHTTSNLGRYSGLLNGAPNFSFRHRRWVGTPRLLYHSGLGERIQYPCIPTRTMGFSLDLLSRVDFAEAKTLTSNVTQQWQAVAEDVVIKEIFEGPLSQQQSFFWAVYQFYRRLINVDEYMLWRPLDLTDKVYRVRILNMLLNGEDMDANAVGIFATDKWLTGPIEIHLKLAPTVPPSAVIYQAGNLE